MSNDIEPSRNIQITGEAKNILPVQSGDEISAVTRTASKLAATENKTITFFFNKQQHEISPETAKIVLTPENIRENIESLQTRIEASRRLIEKLEARIEEEETLGKMLYGEDFVETIKQTD